MATVVSDLKVWLDSLSDNDVVFINEGGLTLEIVGSDEAYYEIGGELRPIEESGGQS